MNRSMTRGNKRTDLVINRQVKKGERGKLGTEIKVSTVGRRWET